MIMNTKLLKFELSLKGVADVEGAVPVASVAVFGISAMSR